MKKLKKIAKIGAIILGVLLVLVLIANAVFISITGSRLEKRLAEIRAAGDPVMLAELKRPTPPPEQNASTYLSRAQADVKAFGKETSPFLDADPERPFEDQLKAVRAVLAAYPQMIPLLEQASECPDCNLGLPYDANPTEFIDELLTNQGRFRACAQVLSWQARLLRHDGKLDQAMRTCLTLLRMSRQLEREPPLLLSALVVIACRTVALNDANDILRSGAISNAVRAELDKELALIDDPHFFERVLKCERAMGISHFGSVIPVGWYNRGIANAWESSWLDTLNEQLTLVGKPYSQAMNISGERKTPTQFDIFSSLALPAILKVREAWCRTQALTRCLRIVNAMQQKDVWKEKEINLADLGLAKETLVDPYNDSSIKLTKAKGEWVIYCVGGNLKDDGGSLDSYLDVGLGPIPADRR